MRVVIHYHSYIYFLSWHYDTVIFIILINDALWFFNLIIAYELDHAIMIIICDIFFVYFQIMAVILLVLLYSSKYIEGSSFKEVISTGTTFGYVVILVGVTAGSLMGTPVNRRVVCLNWRQIIINNYLHYLFINSICFILITGLVLQSYWCYSLHVHCFCHLLSLPRTRRHGWCHKRYLIWNSRTHPYCWCILDFPWRIINYYLII